MHHVKLFAELHWAVQRPKLDFSLNQQVYYPKLVIVGKHHWCERVIYDFSSVPLLTKNTLKIQMCNKTDDLNTIETDHWIGLKDISVDDVLADASFHKHTTFRHTMPDQWINNMRAKGITILEQYSPGSDIRLNGVCTIDFEAPMYLQRILDLWSH